MKPGELTRLQRLRQDRSDKLLEMLVAEQLGVQLEPECSRGHHHPDEGGGLSPGRAWCRKCEAERRRRHYRDRIERSRESDEAA